MYRIQRTRATSAAPTPIISPRSTITPRMPQNSTRCWYRARDREEAEDHRDDEDVVHRERLLDDEAGQVFLRACGPIIHQTKPPNSTPRVM